MGYVATLPTCGPLLIVPPALKQWVPPKAAGVMYGIVYSDLVGYQTSDITLLWSIITKP